MKHNSKLLSFWAMSILNQWDFFRNGGSKNKTNHHPCQESFWKKESKHGSLNEKKVEIFVRVDVHAEKGAILLLGEQTQRTWV